MKLTLFLVFTLLLKIYLNLQTTDVIFPISFSIVRSSSISANFTTYMKNIGYPQLDLNGYNIGYNLIALDGYKTATTFQSISNELSPLATWVSVYSRILGNARNLYGKSSSDVQAYIKAKFNQRASKIILNAYSFQRPVSQKNTSASQQADAISQFVNTYYLDGVSIDFQDFNSVKQKTASSWLTTLLKTLRKNFGKKKLIVLQVHPTFIKQIPLFKDSIINSYVDVFVIKYYNLLQESYNTFETIFQKAKYYNGTSIWQFQLNSDIKIDICKTVIAKPSSSYSTWDTNSYLAASTLNSIFDQARTKYSWFGGYANLDFGSDPNSEFQLAALNILRSYCNKFETCFCK